MVKTLPYRIPKWILPFNPMMNIALDNLMKLDLNCSTIDEMVEYSHNKIEREAYTEVQIKKYAEIVRKLEKEKGGPVIVHEVRKYMKRNKIAEFADFGYFPHYVHLYITYWQMPNELYWTPNGQYCSFEKWNDDYETFNERAKKWTSRGYELDHLNRIRAGTTRTVDFDQLFNVLSSKDEQLLKDNAWIFEDSLKYPKYLSKASQSASGRTVETMGNHIAYLTFLRVGNSFLRKII
jgi:hypothetical protein